MSTPDFITALVGALLGGGGLAFLRALFRGFGSLRAGARATERAALTDLRKRAEDAEDDRDFWRDVAADYRWQLREKNIEPRPANPVPPSARPKRGT